MGTVWIENDKQRELQFKDILQKLDCYKLVKMIKTLYLKNEKRMAEGKKATSTDQRYFKLAEWTLHEELAVVLEMPQDEIGHYIIEQVEHIEKNS